MSGSNYLLKMAFPFHGDNCKKSFITKYKRNKHEKLKNDGPQLEKKVKIPCIGDLYRFRTTIDQQMAAMLSSNINITLLN